MDREHQKDLHERNEQTEAEQKRKNMQLKDTTDKRQGITSAFSSASDEDPDNAAEAEDCTGHA